MALASARKRFASHNPSAASPSAVELPPLGVCAALPDLAKGGDGRFVLHSCGVTGGRRKSALRESFFLCFRGFFCVFCAFLWLSSGY